MKIIKKRNIVVITVLLIMTVGLFPVMVMAQEGGGAEKIVLKLAHNAPPNHPFQLAYMRFKEILEKEAPGQFDVQIFPSEQLGTEENSTELVDMGLIAGNITGALQFVPELGIFQLPFLFKDTDSLYRVLDGDPGKRYIKLVEDKINVVVLGYLFGGIRNLHNRIRPVLVPDDMKGLKIRTMGSPIVLETFNALGAQATTMSWGEVYTALQQRVIDGGENDMIDMLVERFYEVSKYISLTGHIYHHQFFIFSKAIFDKLSDDQKDLIIKAGKEAIDYEREVMEQQELDARKILETEYDVKVFNVDVSLFQEATKSVYEKNADKFGGMKYIQEIINY